MTFIYYLGNGFGQSQQDLKMELLALELGHQQYP
jgi:hypothetical protein